MDRKEAHWLLALVLGAVLVLGVAAPADAQSALDVPDGATVEDGEAPGGFCDGLDFQYRLTCHVMSGVAGNMAGNLVQGSAGAALEAMVEWVVHAAAWLLEQLAELIDAATSPDVEAGWFQGAYTQMTVIAVALMLPLVLLSVIQALLRANGAQLARLVFVYIPVATLGMFAATAVTQMLLAVTDELSAWVGAAIGADLQAFAGNLAEALVATTGSVTGMGVPGFAALMAALLVGFATMVIWVLLVLRQAAIYAGVLFLPLAFAGLVWPASAAWFKRLVEGLVAVIFAKFVIVAVLAMAASSLAAMGVTEGFSVVVAGGSLLLMAVFAPFVLLRLIPVFGSELASTLDGVTTSRTSPVPAAAGAGVYRQIAAANSARAAGMAPGGLLVAGGAAAGAAGAAGAVSKAGQAVKGQADQVAGHGKGAAGAPTASGATGTTSAPGGGSTTGRSGQTAQTPSGGSAAGGPSSPRGGKAASAGQAAPPGQPASTGSTGSAAPPRTDTQPPPNPPQPPPPRTPPSPPKPPPSSSGGSS